MPQYIDPKYPNTRSYSYEPTIRDDRSIKRKIFSLIMIGFLICSIFLMYLEWKEEQIKIEQQKFVGTWEVITSTGDLDISVGTWIFYENQSFKILTGDPGDLVPSISFSANQDDRTITVTDIEVPTQSYSSIAWGKYKIEDDKLCISQFYGYNDYSCFDYDFSNRDTIAELEPDYSYYVYGSMTMTKLPDVNSIEWKDINITISGPNDVDLDCINLKGYSISYYGYHAPQEWGAIKINDVIQINDYDSCLSVSMRYVSRSKKISSIYFGDENTLYVGSAGAGSYSTIHEAIDAASFDDTIFVYTGTYYENIILKDGVSLIGEDTENTIIDGGNIGSVVTIYDAGPETTLSKFTIKNGSSLNKSYNSEGIDLKNASATISNNIITNNYRGIYMAGCSSPIITNNIIKENGGDEIVVFGELEIGPVLGGGLFLHSSNPIVSNNIIINNIAQSGGGVFFGSSATGDLVNNVIVDNTATEKGGGIYVYHYSSPNITNNIIYGNKGQGVNVKFGSFPLIDYNLFWSNTNGNYGGDASGGSNNIYSNPYVVNSDVGDYRLKSTSPCIDRGTNSLAPSTDFDDNPRPTDGDNDRIYVTDIGAFEIYSTDIFSNDSYQTVSLADLYNNHFDYYNKTVTVRGYYVGAAWGQGRETITISEEKNLTTGGFAHSIHGTLPSDLIHNDLKIREEYYFSGVFEYLWDLKINRIKPI